MNMQATGQTIAAPEERAVINESAQELNAETRRGASLTDNNTKEKWRTR
jgi:hypothetical protein